MRDYEELVKALRDEDNCNVLDYIDDAADAIEELQSYADLYKELTEKGQTVARKLIDTYPKWISVEERLPEHGQEVLCACRAGIYEVFKYVDGISGPWYKDSRRVYMKGFVTHWMPLPSTEGLNET